MKSQDGSEGAGGVAQVVELACSNPSTEKKKKRWL
jgi:hypothetical protein